MASTLSGYAIGVTADRRSSEQIALLEGRGAQCLHGPTIVTHPIADQNEIVAATLSLLAQPPDALVLQTGIGIRSWFEVVEATGHAQALRETLATVPLICRGPKTLGASVAEGLEVDWCVAPATAAAVVGHVVSQIEPGARVAVQNDGDPQPWLATRLSQLGYDVLQIPIYRWSLPDDPTAAEVLIRAIVDERVDAVTFTSRPAVANLVAIAADLELDGALRDVFQRSVIPACVGPVTAAQVFKVGFGYGLHPARHRLGSMVQQLTDALVAQARPLSLAGHQLVLRGRQIEGLDQPVQLTGRERAVLLALLQQPGFVRSKTALLDEVWKSRTPGTHTVEVTVGRLRRRLGPAGKGIETVIRRGYRLRTD